MDMEQGFEKQQGKAFSPCTPDLRSRRACPPDLPRRSVAGKNMLVETKQARSNERDWTYRSQNLGLLGLHFGNRFGGAGGNLGRHGDKLGFFFSTEFYSRCQKKLITGRHARPCNKYSKKL
jgi:hypothetical protein